jgi:hypothetical protein
LASYSDRNSRLHLEFIRDKLAMMMNYHKTVYPEENRSWAAPATGPRPLTGFNALLPEELMREQPMNQKSCWQNEEKIWRMVE